MMLNKMFKFPGRESPYLSKRTCLSHSSIFTLHPSHGQAESPSFSYVPTALIPTLGWVSNSCSLLMILPCQQPPCKYTHVCARVHTHTHTHTHTYMLAYLSLAAIIYFQGVEAWTLPYLHCGQTQWHLDE